MDTVEEKPKSMHVRAFVQRSNPVVMRELSVPISFTAKELADAISISMGVGDIKNRIVMGELDITNSKTPIAESLKVGDILRVELNARTDVKPLQVAVLCLELSGQSLKFPIVTRDVGLQLPSEFCYLPMINVAAKRIFAGGFLAGKKDTSYSEATLTFRDRMVDNEMRKRFAPDMVLAELDWTMAVPMREIIDKYRVAELKDLADAYQIPYYTGYRKQEIVASICKKFADGILDDMFDDMTAEEYLGLCKLLTGGRDDLPDEGLRKKLKKFENAGLCMFSSKMGSKVAIELMERLNKVYQTDGEKEFLNRKYLRDALTASAKFYGLFTREQYDKVLEIMAPSRFTKEETDRYIEGAEALNPLLIGALEDEEVYYWGLLDKRTAKKLWRDMYHGENAYRIPTLSELSEIIGDERGLKPDNAKTVGDVLTNCSYFCYGPYGYKEWSEDFDVIVCSLRLFGAVESTMNSVVSKLRIFRYGGYTVMQNKESLRKVLLEESTRLPIMALGGYSIKQCPKHIIDHCNMEKAEKKEDELKTVKRRGRKAVKR